ncbi:MAG: thiamine-phosphate kinase [Candidatus Omnitrophica bacterium]|nr:thiamine-phosphate kinase [Candidatus Omnitrophota bacterium]
MSKATSIMAKNISSVGEFGFIDLIRKRMSTSGSVLKGIGDDAAVVSLSPGKKMLLTTDMLLEGAHFTLTMPPSGIGHKAMAVNISDIAAMGGVPKYALVSLGAPPNLPLDYLLKIYQAMDKTAQQYGVSIVGGDTIKSSKLIINVAMVGEADEEKIVYRSGAKVGDRIFVTGRLGSSLKSGRHLTFVPRLKESQYLVKHFKPTAMIDISDGLVGDLGHILKESRVGAVLSEDAIPRYPDASLKNALYDGEDFELIFTVPFKQAEKLKRIKMPFRFYEIGEITDQERQCSIVGKDGVRQKITVKGYTHF